MQHHLVIPRGFGRWILAHRLQIIALLFILTAISVYSIANTPLRTSLLQGFMEDDSEYQDYRRKVRVFGGNSDQLLAFALDEGDRLFTRETFQRIQSVLESFRNRSDVQRATGITEAPWLGPHPPRVPSGESGTESATDWLSRLTYWPRDPDLRADRDMDRIRRAMLEDPFLRETLLTADGTTHVLVVQLKSDVNVEGWNQVRLRCQLEQLIRDAGLGRAGVYSVGVIVTQGWMLQEAIWALVWLLPLGALIISFLVFRIFGSARLVLLTLAISLIAMCWAVGTAAFVFGEITVLVAASPLLILVISTSDTVHLVSAYVAELKAGRSKEESLERMIEEVGGACLLTSVTTFVGFLSLTVVPATAIRHVAVTAAVGVGCALLVAVTLIPIALSWFSQEYFASRARKPALIDRIVERFVAGCRYLSLEHPRMTIAASVGLAVLCIWAGSQVTLTANFAQRFPRSHPMRQGFELFNEKLAGSNILEVIVTVPPEQFTSPRFLHDLANLHTQLLELPEVSRVDSLANLYEIAVRMRSHLLDSPLPHSRSPVEGTSVEGTPVAAGSRGELDRSIPDTQAEAETILQLARRIAPLAVQAVAAPQEGMTRLSVRVTAGDIFEMNQLSNAMRRVARKTMPSFATVEVTGTYPVIGRAAQNFIRGQVKGFTICFLSVMCLIALGVRSVRLSLLAALPNLLPLLLLGGAVRLVGCEVDSDILGVAVISFGLAVDDTIHFLHRYDIEWNRRGDIREALIATFGYSGHAILRTTLILGLGLLPFALSDLLSIRLLGSYLVGVLLFAVLADLLLLPALILVFHPMAAAPMKQDGPLKSGPG